MPKIIVKCKYIKGVRHRSNMIKYMATRDGVEKIYKKNQHMPSTLKQKEMIAQLIDDYPDSIELFEYSDYIHNPTRENASECISTIMDHNLDTIATKQNYVDYIANRPRVEKIGDHGMFSDSDKKIDLNGVAKEVGNHQGNVWTNIISLRRADAQRLGYDSADSWIKLCRAKRNELAATINIKPENLTWYAAFHNEGHHPHIHMIVYSKDNREGYVSKQSITKMRSMYARDIFIQDLLHIYKEQTTTRDTIKKLSQTEIANLISTLHAPTIEHDKIQQNMKILSEKLKDYQGKKVYQYLPKDMKQVVDKIVSELENKEEIQSLLKEWWNHKDEINQTYCDKVGDHVSLTQLKEFKSIKNIIIKEASNLVASFHESVHVPDDAVDETVLKDVENMEMVEELSIELKKTDADGFCMKWSKEYKKAKAFLYGNEEVTLDIMQAVCLLEDEVLKKNVLAIADLANVYAKGISIPEDEEKATELYKKAFHGFQMIHKNSEDEYTKEYSSYRIGKLLYYGQGCEQDYVEAEQWFLKAPASEYALYNLGSIYSRGLGMDADKEKGFDCFKRASEMGNPYASYEAGRMIEKEEINCEKESLAIHYYEQAYTKFCSMEEQSNDDNLQYRIGEMCYNGKGIEEVNIPLAIRYLEKSVKMQNEHAMFLLARIYLKQNDIENIPKAISWLEKLANKDNVMAANILAKEYKNGINVERNLDKAIHYYKKSAEQKDCFAEYQLAKIYQMLGDRLTYIENLQLSAEHGNEIAQFAIGKEYLNDDTFDIDKSLYWLKQAAEKNNQFAQYTLGKLFLFGKYVEQDKEVAIQYLECSALQGNEYATYLLEHRNDPYHQQSTMIMTTRLFHHLGNIFTEHMLPDVGNPLLHVDKKLRKKLRMKKQALGQKADDTSSMEIK